MMENIILQWNTAYLAKVKIDDGNSYYTAVVASLPGNT